MSLEPRLTDIICSLRPDYTKYKSPNGTMVVKLNKALYGCVQSARQWYNHLAGVLKKFGFKPNQYDTCVFNRGIGMNQCTIAVHVDDLLITCSNKTILDKIVKSIKDEFIEVKSTSGNKHMYLGMVFDFNRKEKSVAISMPGYVEQCLAEYQVKGTASTPATTKLFS
eukprot:gene45343-57774_t